MINAEIKTVEVKNDSIIVGIDFYFNNTKEPVTDFMTFMPEDLTGKNEQWLDIVKAKINERCKAILISKYELANSPIKSEIRLPIITSILEDFKKAVIGGTFSIESATIKIENSEKYFKEVTIDSALNKVEKDIDEQLIKTGCSL
jgi:hypothetical protein